MIRFLLLAAVAAFFGGAIIPVRCLQFNFPLFTDENQELILENNARIFLNAIQVTPDVRGAPITNESGRAVYKDPFLIRNRDKIASFNTTFEIIISPQTAPVGGEGLAFILAANHSAPADSYGQWLGIVNAATNGTPEAKIIAVEFDTRKNYPEDIDSNHVGLDLNGVFSIEQRRMSEFGVNLSSELSVFAMIQYDTKNISVFVSMSNKTEDLLKNRVIFQPLNLSILPDEVYVGFSASTSNFTQLNCVKSWQFNGTDISDNNRKNRLWIWLTVAGIGALLICGAVFGIIFHFCTRKRRLNHPEEAYEGIEHQLQDFSIAPRAQKYEFKELKKATNNFDPKNGLGKGGFGTVYKGNLMNREVAVKRISKDSRQGKQEFIAEVATIGSLHHKNLVKLIGWCYEKRDLLLVYEFMPNGSLDKLIFGNKLGGNEIIPNWETRQNIICGVAEALDYLHNGCEKTVLHRDVKSSNIMLDSKFEAKLGDFGLARTMRRTEQTHHSTREIAGTPGYMAPEIFLTSRATAETDVYAFGVLVLEVICGRKPGNPLDLGSYDGSIAHWVWEFHKEDKLVEAVDESIEGQYVEEEIEYLLKLGLSCCHPNPLQRPSMRNVLAVLKGEANPPILPNERPSFVWPPMPPSFKEDNDTSLKDSQLVPFTELSGR
ncbi:probable L-type lectin-domain containing receptor kinase S.5 [Benincasa hispida]|uniref:probable L-type lectin-domain containing receptor kinase S.5 n=1 Tax=Benincasa hispida TaxID=102211 RepID=UPI001900F570|nr:probable L-type lectin-domain containing receptor kinase S.5 [Benincasa hispida]